MIKIAKTIFWGHFLALFQKIGPMKTFSKKIKPHKLFSSHKILHSCKKKTEKN